MFKGCPKQVENCSLSTPQEPISSQPCRTLPVVPDLLSNLPSIPAAASLGNPPSLMLRLSGALGLRVLTTLMKTLWVTPAGQWRESLRAALGVLLWKHKGPRSDVLLAEWLFSGLSAALQAAREIKNWSKPKRAQKRPTGDPTDCIHALTAVSPCCFVP